MAGIVQVERAKRWTVRLLGFGLPLIAVLFLFVDRQVDTWVALSANGIVSQIAHAYTNLGDRYPLMALVFAGFIYSVACEWRHGATRSGRIALYVCLSFATALVLGDMIKFVFGRARPVLLLTHDIYGFTWFAKKGLYHSFPSGHTLRTFSLAAALSLRFPRLTGIALSLAILEAVSRVLVLKHYPSDVTLGAMVGCLAALWIDAMLRRAWEEPDAV